MQHQSTQRFLLTALVLMALLACAGPATAGNPNPGVSSPHAKAFGKSYEEWATAWWQWVFSLPGANHPLFDTTGADCDKGQQGKVWFLAGLFNPIGQTTQSKVSRDCTIPNGKAIFFPVFNGWVDNVGEPDPFTQQELIDRCESVVEDPTLAVTLDGRQLQNLEGYKISPTFFSYTMPDHGFFEAAFDFNFSGSPPAPGAITCGYYVMLTLLSKGHHDLHIETSNADKSFTQDVRYDLTVTK
jgi:hypothetical protein